MEDKKLEKLERYLDKLDGVDFKRLENLNIYLERNGEIVIDLMMRVRAFEEVLKAKGATEEEIQKAVDESYAKLRAASAQELEDNGPKG